MTPKEKAKEFIMKMSFETHAFNAKSCALVAVDEILESQPRYPSEVDWDDCGATQVYYYQAQREEAKQYWQQVKEEIQKI